MGARARAIASVLAEEFPGSAAELCALEASDPFELLVATILSAQCTDERVNMVTPALFAAYPTPSALASARPEDLEEIIRSTGFFRSKAKNLLAMSSRLERDFGGKVPSEMAELTSLAGVGRKTANVVRSVALELDGFPVDTHVARLSRRLGLTASTDPEKIEADLCSLLDPSDWGAMSLRLILHGRRTCVARKPKCGTCPLVSLCPSAGMGGQ